MFSGRIHGKGPRYCPSIEDKINRFGDRDGHQLFLEPEQADIGRVYINGFSSQNRFASEQEWKTVLWNMIPNRILEDYGEEQDGRLFHFNDYENFFAEVGKRKWRRPIYAISRAILGLASLVLPSARFSRHFPFKTQ